MIVSLGNFLPPLSAVIAGSSQFVIAPVKILAAVVADSCRFVICCPRESLRLYMSEVPPATSGTYWKDACFWRSWASSFGSNGISEAAKSDLADDEERAGRRSSRRPGS